MNFQGHQLTSEVELFSQEVGGKEFFHKSFASYPYLMRAKFFVKSSTSDRQLIYPTFGTETSSLRELKESFTALYGPYTLERFSTKVNGLYSEFELANNIADDERSFMKKLWILKQLFQIFEESLGMLEIRVSKMITGLYGKSIEFLRVAEGKLSKYGRKTVKYANESIAIIRRVQKKLELVIATNPKFLLLLPPSILQHYVTNADPLVISKLGSLISKVGASSWIEPSILVLLSPSHNVFWKEFWVKIFARIFKISIELCEIIAEYMPKILVGESFLDYFRRKYDARNGVFVGSVCFDIKKQTTMRNGVYVANITVTI